MNQKLQEIYEASIAAIYGGKEFADDILERIDSLSDDEKKEVAKAIHDYSQDNIPKGRRERMATEAKLLSRNN